METTKVCEGCNTARDLIDFYSIADRKCKACKKQYRETYKVRERASLQSFQRSSQKNKKKEDGKFYRRCDRCGESKLLERFRLIAKGRYTDRSDYCRDCEYALKEEVKEKKRQEKIDKDLSLSHAERVQAYQDNRYKNSIFTYYRLTLARYQEMLKMQNGLCAICKNPPEEYKRLVVDHDHKTGNIRGLLCEECNHGLGNFKDSQENLFNAAEYLRKSVWEY